jgi:CheY-like chemotaxis protein
MNGVLYMKGSRYSRGKILAVDNALMFLNSLKMYLEDAPYELHCVTSGREALKYLDDHTVDLIFLDVEMPELDGYELAKRIKQRGIKTPVVFLTANAEKEDLEKAASAGAASVLPKPFQASQLLAKIKEYL